MNTRQKAQRWPTITLIALAVAAVAIAGAAYFARHGADDSSSRGHGVSTVPAAPPASIFIKRSVPYADAQPILDAHRSRLPAELAVPPGQLEAAWSAWVSRHDTE